MTEWFVEALVKWEYWAMLGALLITLEIFDGNGFLVSLGISALVLAGLEAWGSISGFVVITNWKMSLLVYAGISLILAYFIRKLPMFRPNKDDISDY